jgi:hypothetical protein
MIVDWLEKLPPHIMTPLAEAYGKALAEAGLTVHRADKNDFIPIPPSLSPEVIADDALADNARNARLLLSATVKASRWTLGPGIAVGERLYQGFTPLEWECLRRDPARLERIATARVDYFRDASGRARALELNATIPAMQGYSDLAAHAWIAAVAAVRRAELPPEIAATIPSTPRLVEAIGSNTADLLRSLLAHYAAAGGKSAMPSILIVSRRGDSQLGELRHYERAFNGAGLRTLHVWVDEVELDSSGRLHARGEPFDLLYRHIFARRVPADSAMAKLLVDPGPNILLNPVCSPLEVKGVLALLSEAEHDPARAATFSLDDDELAAIQQVVPWTRLCVPGPATLPDGTHVDDLPTWVAAHPERLVLKRSWDYGGKGVILGPAQSMDRMRELYNVDDWPQFTTAASTDPNAWVVQEYVAPKPVRHLLVERSPSGHFEPQWRDLFVDISGYANLGVSPQPRGGVTRASSSRIVNIALGGGVAPLIPSSVIASLFP